MFDMAFRLCVCFASVFFLFSLPGSSQNQPRQPDPNYYDSYDAGAANLSPLERRGRETWYFWTGGGQRFGRMRKTITKGARALLQFVVSRRNGTRFRDLGVITQPGCRKAAAPDEYGLWFDDCQSE